MRVFSWVVAVIFVACIAFSPAQAAEPYVILMPGGGGITPSDFLVRNKAKFDRAGIRSELSTSFSKAIKIAADKNQQFDVFIIGMSKGAMHVSKALAGGIKVKGAVFVSADYQMVSKIVGSPSKLPKTLMVHHLKDKCPKTPAARTSKFIKWAKGRAQLVLIKSGGAARGGPCGPMGAHGFYKRDKVPIKAIISFIRANS